MGRWLRMAVVLVWVIVVVVAVIVLFQQKVGRNPHSSIDTVDDPSFHRATRGNRLLHGFVLD